MGNGDWGCRKRGDERTRTQTRLFIGLGPQFRCSGARCVDRRTRVLHGDDGGRRGNYQTRLGCSEYQAEREAISWIAAHAYLDVLGSVKRVARTGSNAEEKSEIRSPYIFWGGHACSAWSVRPALAPPGGPGLGRYWLVIGLASR